MPMCVILVTGVNDNYKFHPDVKKEFLVSTTFNPPTGYVNRLNEVIDINQRVIEFRDSYVFLTPRFHRYGVRTGKRCHHREMAPYSMHQLSQWRETDKVTDRFLLIDRV